MNAIMDSKMAALKIQYGCNSKSHFHIYTVGNGLLILPASTQNVYQNIYLFCLSILNFCPLTMGQYAQRDGRPAEYRWRPLFNAAKFV